MGTGTGEPVASVWGLLLSRRPPGPEESMKRSRRTFLRNVGLGATALGVSPHLAAEKGTTPRPNIVFLLVDDLSWSDVGAYGSRYCETPKLDHLSPRGPTIHKRLLPGSHLLRIPSLGSDRTVPCPAPLRVCLQGQEGSAAVRRKTHSAQPCSGSTPFRHDLLRGAQIHWLHRRVRWKVAPDSKE